EYAGNGPDPARKPQRLGYGRHDRRRTRGACSQPRFPSARSEAFSALGSPTAATCPCRSASSRCRITACRRSEADVLRRGGRVAFAPMRVLVTGGAGFVGANVAVALAARHPDWQLVALDNLRRRGAELNLARLCEAGVVFLHGDVREPADLEAADEVDALVECSAEPSVLAGLDGGLDYLVRTNLL